MPTQRLDVGILHCLDEVQCDDTITATGWNKIVQTVEGIFSIGTHMVDLPEMRVNRNRQPACGWGFGSVAIASTAGTYSDSIVRHPIHLNANYDRWSLDFEVNPIDKSFYSGIGTVGIRFRHTSIKITAYGYAGNTQDLVEVIPLGPALPGQVIAPPNIPIIFNITGMFNSNMLPPSGEEFAGRIVVEITTETSIPLGMGGYWTGYATFQITANLDWYGLLYLKGRMYKTCP